MWNLENCTRVLFVNDSSQCNVTRQRDPNVLYFTFVMYPIRGFKICFFCGWDDLGAHFYTYWECTSHVVGFLPRNFNIFLRPNRKSQKPKHLAIVCMARFLRQRLLNVSVYLLWFFFFMHVCMFAVVIFI